MLKERNVVLRRILVLSDMFMLTISFVLALFIRKQLSGIYPLDFPISIQIIKLPYLSVRLYTIVYFVVIMIWYLILASNGMYRSLYFKSPSDAARIIIKSAVFVAIAFSAAIFLLKIDYVSRLFFAIFMVLASISLILEKLIIFPTLHHRFWRGYNRIMLLIVGTGPRAVRFADKINSHPEWGYRIAKVADFDKCMLAKGSKIEKCELIPDPEDMRELLHKEPIDQVIFVVPKSRIDRVQDYLYVCNEEGIDASVAVDFFDVTGAVIHHTDLEGIPLLTIEKTFGREWQLFIKRTIDVIISGLGIIILSPLFLAVMGLIKLTSPGPVFFSQQRIGLRGRKFTMYKFRSMFTGSEKKLKELSDLNEMEGPVFKIINDPRITPLGKFIRRTSIDELPQLYNVFMGRLSLVGPRPPLEKEVKEYKHWQRRRLSVRPGITCLWQAYHRDERDFEKWTKTDLEYLDSWSLWLDLKIFMRTILTVITGKGAY